MVWNKLIYFPSSGEGRCSELGHVVFKFSESQPDCALSMKCLCSDFVPFLFMFLLKITDITGEMCCV